MKHLRPAIVLTLWFAIGTGLLFPVAIWLAAQAAFPRQANGSLVRDAGGRLIGSDLIGQAFIKPEYFHPRPSAAGDAYDAANSGGTNLGPTNAKLIHGVHDPKDPKSNFDGVEDLAKIYRADNHLSANAVIPADAATRSASGLDPDISVANALLQAPRVAAARGVTVDEVKQLVVRVAEGRFLDVFGEERVNVLALNKALDRK